MDDQSESRSPAISERHALCIDDIPPEIISEILLEVLDSYGDSIYHKWRSPLLFRRVSRRFYRITTDTPPLWRYLFIRQPIHRYLRHHASRSGLLSLTAHVEYGGEPEGHESNGDNSDESSNDDSDGRYSDKDGVWRDIINILVPIIPRLGSLLFHSPWNNQPAIELFRHKIPILTSLDVEGVSGQWLEHNFFSSHPPAIRSLRLVSTSSLAFNLPDTLDELYLGNKGNIQMPPAPKFWISLPLMLRVLRVENIVLDGSVPPLGRRIHLPCLTELYFRERCLEEQVSILRLLDAPSLHTLGVHIDYDDPAGPDAGAWFLDFPALTRLTWHSTGPVLRLDNLLRHCGTLRFLCIKIPTFFTSVANFVAALVADETLLPLVEDLAAPGASMNNLRKPTQARPQLKRLKVFKMDLGVGGPAWAGEYAEWQRCAPWLASRSKLYCRDVPSYCWEDRWGPRS